MKKIIANLLFGKLAREERARRNHNAKILQNLLNVEHDLKNRVNSMNNTVYTTKKAIEIANKTNFCNHNSLRSLEEADFRQIRERINDNEDEPDSLLTINPYSNLCATKCATIDARQKPKF